MSYCIYKTNGVILTKRDFGESDRLFSVFTKDFGRLELVAQGVRYLKSKLRYSLSGTSFLKIAFVPTSNEYWRLVDVNEFFVFSNIRNNPHKTNSLFKILAFLERLVQGQEEDQELWEKLKQALIFLEKNKLQGEDFRKFEEEISKSFLGCLGYAQENIEHSLEQSML